MKRVAIFLCCCVLSVPVFGQRKERRAVEFGKGSGLSAVRGDGVGMSRRLAAKKGKLSSADFPDDLRLPQAPGVLQLNTSDTGRTVWFVVSETIPKDTVFHIQIYPPLGSSQALQVSAVADEDIQPGNDYRLPQIPDFGGFWPAGYITYNVVVEPPGGGRTHSAAELRIDFPQPFEDLLSPLIFDWSERVVDREVIVNITGVFEGDPVTIAIDNFVVPSDAISRPSSEAIQVNLNRVPDFPLGERADYLLTVAQMGWTDTRVFTHIPFPPDNYNQP